MKKIISISSAILILIYLSNYCGRQGLVFYHDFFIVFPLYMITAYIIAKFIGSERNIGFDWSFIAVLFLPIHLPLMTLLCITADIKQLEYNTLMLISYPFGGVLLTLLSQKKDKVPRNTLNVVIGGVIIIFYGLFLYGDRINEITGNISDVVYSVNNYWGYDINNKYLDFRTAADLQVLLLFVYCLTFSKGLNK